MTTIRRSCPSDKQIHRIDLHVLAQAGRTIFQHRRSALVAYAQRPAVLQLADRHDADHTVLGSHFHTQVAERLLEYSVPTVPSP